MSIYAFNNWFKNEKTGWHKTTVLLNDKDVETFYLDIIQWLYYNVENCTKHCRWRSHSQGIDVKFRYERDYIMFTLTWL